MNELRLTIPEQNQTISPKEDGGLTDLALLTGAIIYASASASPAGSGQEGSSQRGRPAGSGQGRNDTASLNKSGSPKGICYSSTPDGSGNPMGLLTDGSSVSVFRARKDIGIRPLLIMEQDGGIHSASDPDTHYDHPSEKRLKLGEYPQSVPDIRLQRHLDQLLASSGLTRTGRFWTLPGEEKQAGTTQPGGTGSAKTQFIVNETAKIQTGEPVSRETEYISYEEYGCKEGRFILMDLPGNHIHLPDFLQSILHYRKDSRIWVRVEPVWWIALSGGQNMISEKILTAGIRCCKGSMQYFGNIEQTGIGRFVTGSMQSEILRNIRLPQAPSAKNKQTCRDPHTFDYRPATEEDIIRGAIESGIAVFLHGAPSEGKSARVCQIDPTCEIIYLRNATPESLNGKSVYNQATGEMFDVPPAWLKKVEAKCSAEPDRLHIVFFDEITNALPSIQGIAFNIVLNREVNGIWRLPENARIVAAGNDISDSLAANLLAEPLFNRFAHVYIHTTVPDWLAWAADHGIHPAIYAFIAYKGEEALRSPYNGEKPNADPRKWEMASRMLYHTGRPDMLRSLVGEEITEEFIAFCRKKVLTLNDVLNHNYDPDHLDMDVSEKYAAAIAMLQAEEKDLDEVRHFVGLLGAEYAALFDILWAGSDKKRLRLILESKAVY
ncbi:MAG: hypothetical protein IJ137_03910 [Eubacterium sp.]|nr:hypothetical protein [Eubacterium sp.]